MIHTFLQTREHSLLYDVICIRSIGEKAHKCAALVKDTSHLLMHTSNHKVIRNISLMPDRLVSLNCCGPDHLPMKNFMDHPKRFMQSPSFLEGYHYLLSNLRGSKHHWLHKKVINTSNTYSSYYETTVHKWNKSPNTLRTFNLFPEIWPAATPVPKWPIPIMRTMKNSWKCNWIKGEILLCSASRLTLESMHYEIGVHAKLGSISFNLKNWFSCF